MFRSRPADGKRAGKGSRSANRRCSTVTHTVIHTMKRAITTARRLRDLIARGTGYGEALNVARAVQELEATGLAGIHLEDQVAPKRCGHLAGKQVVASDEMARKIAAAVKARRDPDFLLVARTDARGVNDFEDA